MKKILAGMVSATMLLTMFTGCNIINEESSNSYSKTSSNSSESSKSSEQSSSTGSTDWKDMTLSVDSVNYTPLFDLSDLTDAGWTFDPAIYGLNDYTMTPGVRLSCDVYLIHEGVDNDVLAAGFTNPSDKDIPLMDSKVWALKVNIKDKKNYPEFILPGNIKWNATEEEIKASLGEPTETNRDEANKRTELVYSEPDVKYVHYFVYDDGGMMTFEMDQLA